MAESLQHVQKKSAALVSRDIRKSLPSGAGLAVKLAAQNDAWQTQHKNVVHARCLKASLKHWNDFEITKRI